MLADEIAASVRHHWWLFLLRGLAAIVFGALALLWPGVTVVKEFETPDCVGVTVSV